MLRSRIATAVALALVLATLPTARAADKKDAPAWDVNAAHGKTKRVAFSTQEGTWMDLDLSPDGQQIVFSLLGDLYALPIAGGDAKRLSSGPAWDVQPRFSPDGRELLFTSDRGGGNNLWRMSIDGTGAKQITKEDFRLLNNGVWTPDGNYVIGRKHFTSERSLGAGELWLYHKTGGDGLQLTKKKNDQQDLGEPAVSPDGRYVYFSEDVSPGGAFDYNRNPHGVIYAIRRLDRETGEITDVVASPGGAVRPQPSPDGKSLAFVKRVANKSVLHVLDLQTGAVNAVWDGLSHDMQEAWAIFGPYSNFDWTPDSSAVVIWAQGKLWRVAMDGGKATNIPFTAQVEQTVAEPVHFKQQIESGTFTPKMIRDVATSPDGKSMVFHALGQLWIKSLPDGTPSRLSKIEGRFEYQPSFSRDGQRLLFTTWTDAEQGHLHELDLKTGEERRLSQTPGFYYSPRYNADGSKVLWSKQSGSSLTGALNSLELGIYWQARDGGPATRVSKDGFEPQFSADGQRILYLTGGGLSKKLMSVGLAGEEPREVFSLKYVDFLSVSPDGNWVAFTELFNAYLVPMPKTGGSIELSKDTSAIPVARLTADVGSYLHWAADSQSVHWMVGNEYYSRQLKDAFDFLPNAPKTLPAPKDLRGIPVGLTAAVDQPKDKFALLNANIITMNGDEQIQSGTILINGDRIEAIGDKHLQVPEGYRQIDMEHRTVMPGIVDVHAHANHFNTGVVPQQNWAYYANLAFGITTMHDPSATTETVFSQAELQRAGTLVGPRVFSTGTILYGADGDFKAVVNSLDDARAHLRRMKANGAFSVKSYNQPRREQHQMINQAARELGMLVVEEGGSTLNHNLPMILDGATSIEHNLPVAPLYQDVIKLWQQTDVRNTPTLVVSYGGLNGEYWWYARDQVWEDKKLNRYFPNDQLAARAVRREIAPDWDYHHITVSKSAKALRDAGVKIQVGGHGQMQGLAPHWEIWSLQQGGMTPFEALRAATIDGADMLGLSHEIGSLEVGKKADLVVVNGDPLKDLRISADTRYVMVNGRLFDVEDNMREIGNHETPPPTFYWQLHKPAQGYGIEYGPAAPCHCPKSAVHRHSH